MKYFIFLYIFLLSILSWTSCKENNQESKEEYYASFIVPVDSVKTGFVKFMMHYANGMYGYDINPDSLVDAILKTDKKLLGGEGVMGNLCITKDSIIYTPQDIYTYLYNGVTSFCIPIKDVINAEIIETDALVFKKRLQINTKNGPIIVFRCKKVLADFHMGKIYDQEISDRINDLIKDNK